MTRHALDVMNRDWWEVIVDSAHDLDACVYRGYSLDTARRVARRERHDNPGSTTVYILNRYGTRVH